jgi:hypothetical protein
MTCRGFGVVLTGCMLFLAVGSEGGAPGEPTAKKASEVRPASVLAGLERGWVANAGQWDKRAAFSAPGSFGTTWVTKEGEVRHVASKEDCEKPTPEASEPEVAAKRFRKPCPVQSWVLAERWVGGKVKGIRGEEELETKVSYFLGNDPAKHRSGLPSYRYLSLGEVWPGVEVKLKASQKTVEKLFYVRPGAELGKVRVEIRGADRVRLSPDGELVIETGLGELRFSKPVAWQEKDGQKLPVQASYRLFGKNRYGFAVQGADPSLPLVIDPILQATYLGGSEDDLGLALAIAGSGDVYVAGPTRSTDFPNTAGGAQPVYGVGTDAFVARLNPSLTTIVQATYLGGIWDEYAYAMALGPGGEVYVAGITASPNFPNVAGGAQAWYRGGDWDGFVARLAADLTANLQSTYLGGTGSEMVRALAISRSGEVYVAGFTDSRDFPNTAGGAQATYGGGSWDGFVAKLDASLTSNPRSSYLGGAAGTCPTLWLWHRARTSTWLVTLGPRTFRTPQVAPRRLSPVATTPSWPGLPRTSLLTPGPPTWGEVTTTTATLWLWHPAATSSWLGKPLHLTFPGWPVGQRQPKLLGGRGSWRGLPRTSPRTPSLASWGEAAFKKFWPWPLHPTGRYTWLG